MQLLGWDMEIRRQFQPFLHLNDNVPRVPLGYRSDDTES